MIPPDICYQSQTTTIWAKDQLVKLHSQNLQSTLSVTSIIFVLVSMISFIWYKLQRQPQKKHHLVCHDFIVHPQRQRLLLLNRDPHLWSLFWLLFFSKQSRLKRIINTFPCMHPWWPAQVAPFCCTHIEWSDDLVAIVSQPTKALAFLIQIP